jgi:cobalt/nickel transport system permease protein
MLAGAGHSLWAVHIADGFLTWPWLVGGFLGLACLAGGALLTDWLLRLLKCRELCEADIAQVAVLTAAFYVASLIHVRLGPTSVHLLLNALLGVILRWRAALAIPVGLLLQAMLFGHGGLQTLGVNSCVLVVPALAAWLLFAGIHLLPWSRRPWFRAVLVALSALVWGLSLVYSVTLLCSNRFSSALELDPSAANALTFNPITLAAVGLGAGVLAWLEPRLENAPEFPLGLLVGVVTVLLTMALSCLVLVYGGEEDWGGVVLLTFIAHLPVAAIEGVVLGFTVGFLARVKPEMLGWAAPDGGCDGGVSRAWASHTADTAVAHPPSANGVTPAGERPHPATPPTAPGRR